MVRILNSFPGALSKFRVLDPTSTDRDLDEHFRRSLGTDYDLIRNKLEQEQLALQKQRMIEEQLLQQQQQQEAAMQAQRQQQQQQTNILKHHKKNQIHQHHQAMLAASQAKVTPPTTPSPPIPAPAVAAAPAATQKQVIITEHSEADEISVDDHFAKALGDTWKQFSENK
jgi:LPS O-antigen subunit length determinant protein (WzzB/FepE family)